MGRPTEKTDTVASIYGLYDRDGNLRYIGKAVDPAKRLKGHMRDVLRKKTPLYNWINKNGFPEMRVIEENCADWREAEIRLIREARERGEKLLNVADGGDQPYCSKEVRAANGRRTLRRLQGLEPWANDSCTREELIISTYTWVRNFYIEHGWLDKAQSVVERMQRRYAENPVTYKLWANV